MVFLKRSRLAAVAQKDLGKERVKSIVFREIARETFLGNFLSLFVSPTRYKKIDATDAFDSGNTVK